MKNYVYKRDRLKMTSLSIVFDAGSNTEIEIERKGTMHLMEHLLCKTFIDLYPILHSNNIEWNAYTSEDKIEFWYSGLSDRFTSDMKIDLVKRLTGGLDCIGEEVFEQEKNVVIQEYRDCAFDGICACHMNILRKYWNNWQPVGNELSIRNFTYADMLETYNKYFRIPARIVEVGPEKTEELEGMCATTEVEHATFKFGNYKDNELVKVDYSVKTPVYLLCKKQVTSSDYPYLYVGLKMLTADIHSPYYDELRVKNGFSYYVHCSILKNVNRGIVSISACGDTERADDLCHAFLDLADRTDKLLTKQRFKEIMSYLKATREKCKVLKYQNTEEYTNLTKLKMPSNLDKITFDKVRKVTIKYLSNIAVVKGI